MKTAIVENITKVLSKHSSIITQDDRLQAYRANCEGFDNQTGCVIKIGCTDDIRQVLQLATRCADDVELAFSVCPISTGQNWGYGSGGANAADSIVLDLSALASITINSETLGIVTVQPGVTQQMLYDELLLRQLDFMVPVTGAGPSCSILANALERGYGITPFTDHFAAVNSIKGYLADGSFYQSPISELDKSGTDFIDKTYKYGIGPYIDGLFTQSGFAVVTEITIRLKRRTAAFDSFYVQFRQDEDFEQAQAVAFKILQLLDGVVGSVNIMDQRRLLSMMADNPNGRAKHLAMSAAQVAELSKRYDTPGWMLVGTLYGQPSIVKAARKEIKGFVGSSAKRLIFSGGALLRVARAVLYITPDSWLSGVRAMLKSLDMGIEIMQGKPNQVALPLAYWRNPEYKPGTALHPAKDGCGLLWYAPLIPMHAATMRQFINMVRQICPRYGIEPMITFTSLKYDTVDSTIPIVFNRKDPTAVEQARQCLDELVSTGLGYGWVPYRLNLRQQRELLNANSAYWQTVQKLKLAIDPKNIINPGRYQPAYFNHEQKKPL
ncbi:FAD-binding oxidoreductase [Rheinheimera sp.]|uniref:FAD-binding oxidoreductase n=1 Tax=Rheinheimera sp. TaxID=1869214 RepID=UPI0027358E55|nr:FAD-binding protein [Rheinheimera sp.]MDP2715842.1 FAD-binding protein [Rheinheimera sp.]